MTDTEWVAKWAAAFALTLVVELSCAVPLLGPAEASVGRRTGIVAIAQLATHPVVWFVIPALHLGRTRFLWVAELWAVAAETCVYLLAFPSLRPSRALVVSGVANGASLSVGLLFRALFGVV